MKKIVMMVVVGALVVSAGFAAYAQYGGGRGMMNGPRSGDMMYNQQAGSYGPQGGMMYGKGTGWRMGRGGRGGGMYAQGQQMQGRGRGRMYAQGQMQGRGGRWNNSANATCSCGANYGRWNGPANQQQRTAPEMMSEEKITESAQEYLTKYLSDYSIDKVEKDGWRPLYFITVKGENDAVQKMIVHGFSGQVMHVYPEEVAEETPAEETPAE